MKRELLERAGIDCSLPAAAQAAALVRAMPLRFDSVVGRRDPAFALESGWFAGAGECIHVMSEVFRGNTGRGTAFGGPWPYMMSGGRLLAPAMPVVLGDDRADGPDGCYRLVDGVVFREAVGHEGPLLVVSGSASDRGSGFDLLWFGDAERYLVRAGRIEIEDLFSVMRLPASRTTLGRLVVRARRPGPEALEGLALADSAQEPAEIEVRRLRELLAGRDWRDPERLFAAKAGVERTAMERDQLTVEWEGGHDVVFNIMEDGAGWRALVGRGHYPFRLLTLSVSDDTIGLTGTLRADLDPLSHSLRERLAFELQADLVALGAASPRVEMER